MSGRNSIAGRGQSCRCPMESINMTSEQPTASVAGFGNWGGWQSEIRLERSGGQTTPGIEGYQM